MDANQTRLLATCTSKYFEEQVELLRKIVSEYICTGICRVNLDYDSRNRSALLSSGTVMALCKEIAKARSTPFVSAEQLTVRIVDGVSTFCMKVTIPAKAKALASSALMFGYQTIMDGNYRSNFDHPIQYQKRASGPIIVYYNGPQGEEAFNTWLMHCETESKYRFVLGLPPKVTRASVRG